MSTSYTPVRSGAAATAVASATLRDLLRRPSTLLAAAATAALLLVLPGLCARAVEDADRLALQTGVATVSLFLALFAGFAGLRAGAAEGDLGAAPEWRAAPLNAASYVTGRAAGILAACAAAVVVLAPFLVLPQRAALADDPPTTFVVSTAAVGLLAAAAQSAAVAILLATIAAPQLAAVLFVAQLVASRTVVPELASRGGWPAFVCGLAPDPTRADFARELSFHRPLDPTSAALACLSTLAYAAACLALAAWTLRRRGA